MRGLQTGKVAMTVGLFMGGWHLIWSLLVYIGLAQPLLDFVFWMHMIGNPYRVTGFSVYQALVLVVITYLLGYIGGAIFANIWNYFHK